MTAVTTPKAATTKASPVASAFSKVALSNIFATVAENARTSLQFARFDYSIVKEFPIFRHDSRFNDSLPTVTTKFTSYEEMSGVSSTRPEIITISEFKPLYADNSVSITPSGDFLDAQVKLMNLRQQAIISLINDMKKDKQLATQLDQQEGNFLQHIRNLRTRVTFLQTVQDSIDKTSKLFDTRDPSLKVDVKALLSQYYRQAFDDVNAASAAFPLYGYSDLLASHGFSKNRTLGFSGTKIYLQILNEAKKMLRAGSDDFLGIDPSLVGNDSDPAKLNRRTFKDPHVELGKSIFPSLADVVQSRIHSSDIHLTSALNLLSNAFAGLDNAFAGSTSEEITYAKKLRTLTREYAYSKALADSTTVDLLKQFGYTVGDTFGNQQLFDAVYGQIGNRITDDRSNVNQNTMSSIASKVVDNTSILTFEADYLQNDDGSTFTPGASYYISSVVRPSDSGFSLANPAELTKRMNSVIDKYIDFLGKFNILPKTSNRLVSQDSASLLASDPVTMLNTLYQVYVEPSTGIIKSDVADTPMVNFLGAAANDSRLRANLLLYMYCAANMAGDGMIDQAIVDSERANLRTSDFVRDDDQNTKVSGTLNKLISNCILRYKQVTGDYSGSTSIEKSLKNFNEKALLSRIIAFVVQLSGVLKNDNVAITTKGFSRYSLATDLCLIALGLQIALDSARRYAHIQIQRNAAFNVNANYLEANVGATTRVQTTLRQIVTPKISSALFSARGFSPAVSSISSAVLAFDRFFSKAPLKQSVETRLNREDELTIKSAFAPLNLAKVCRDSLQQFVMFLEGATSVSSLNDILRVVGDRKLVELLGEHGQVQILTDVMDDVLSRIDPDAAANATATDVADVTALSQAAGSADDLKMFDDSFVTSASVNALKAALSDSVFNTQLGSNIRLVSVGLPHGFSSKLRNNFKISTFAEQIASKTKQSDVVVLDVYKIDVRYPDLVFKPISKVFELSRFAVRNEKQFASVKVGAGLNKALDAIPTKDYSNIGNPKITLGTDQVVADSNYDFMAKDDCRSMVRNHVMSYLLELYFRLLTGIPTSERELYIADPDDTDKPAPFITKMILSYAADKVFQVPAKPNLAIDLGRFSKVLSLTTEKVGFNLFTAAAGSKSPIRKFNPSEYLYETVSDRTYAGLFGHASAAADAGPKRTVYSDAEQTAKRLLSPKVFERIFWIAVDPDDYEIDYDETLSSPVGQSTFSKLQQAGEIEVQTTTVGQSPRNVYKMRDLKASQQELVFEKYFITVRAYSPLSQRNS